MYKVGKSFIEDVNITINSAGKRVAICPICNNEIILEDYELDGFVIVCGLCDIELKLID